MTTSSSALLDFGDSARDSAVDTAGDVSSFSLLSADSAVAESTGAEREDAGGERATSATVDSSFFTLGSSTRTMSNCIDAHHLSNITSGQFATL